jgi:hypothetical protein
VGGLRDLEALAPQPSPRRDEQLVQIRKRLLQGVRGAMSRRNERGHLSAKPSTNRLSIDLLSPTVSDCRYRSPRIVHRYHSSSREADPLAARTGFLRLAPLHRIYAQYQARDPAHHLEVRAYSTYNLEKTAHRSDRNSDVACTEVAYTCVGCSAFSTFV